MKSRLVLTCLVALLAALSAPRSEAARGIRTDGNMNCNGPPASAIPNLKLGTGDTANPGVGALPVWACNDTDPTTPFSGLPFDSTTSVLYAWTPIGDDPTLDNPLSSYNGSLGGDGIVAMVDVFNLTGTYLNDTEVDFDYDSEAGSCSGSSSSTCCPASAASLTWAGETYHFSSPCTTPLLFFNSDGKKIPAPVPEPDTLMLMCVAGVPLLLWAWRRKRLSRAQG
jgi:PEP-CTERM motif